MSGHEPKTRKGELTRDKLMETARDIFGTNGFYNTSVVEITQKAGVAQGTFYVYFDSKKDIFRQLIIMLDQKVRREIQAAVSNIEGRKEKERVGYKTFFSFIRRNRNLYNIVFEAQWVDEEIYKWFYKNFASCYISGLQEARKNGELRNLNAECLAYCLMGVAMGVGNRWVLWEEGEVPDHIFEDMMDFIFHGMLAEEK